MNRQSFAVSAVVLAACIAAAVWFKACQPVPIKIESITELKGVLESKGFHCAIHHQPQMIPSLVISATPITAEEAALFASSVYGDRKTGKALATKANTSLNFYPSPVTRIWGTYRVIGDESLLLSIDKAFDSTPLIQ